MCFSTLSSLPKNRHVEAQSALITALNKSVRQALKYQEANEEQTVLIPTGDGIAIAFIEDPSFDVHLRVALAILGLVSEHNEASTSDPMTQFHVRVGLSENVDNVVTDINGRRNVAGNGIAMAERIMSKADGDQILISAPVFETLNPRQKYMGRFTEFHTKDKHSVPFAVYQFRSEEHVGLSCEIPKAFATRPPEKPKLSRFVAYYFAHALRNKAFLLSKSTDPGRDYFACVLLSLLAEDSITKAETPRHDMPELNTWHAETASFAEQYDYYRATEFLLLSKLSSLLQEKYLAAYSEYFEGDAYFPSYAFLKTTGLEKLKKEWPAVAEEFGV